MRGKSGLLGFSWLPCLLSACLAAIAGHTQTASVPSSEPFLAKAYRNAKGETMPYRVFVPTSYNAKQKFPLILWLHGAAGRGDDNTLQISGGNTLGTHIWTKPENQAKFPAFVLAPQCPEGKSWARPWGATPTETLRIALEILDAVMKEYAIDPDRVIVAGQSMGGEGTWAALMHARGRFAAAIPLCGYGEDGAVELVDRVPVWVFQGVGDPGVSVAWAREWVAGLRKTGASVKYTEYPGVGHQVWERAFLEPELITWVMSQKRSR
jgi:predicted peptidase